jgi:hypothetical protein
VQVTPRPKFNCSDPDPYPVTLAQAACQLSSLGCGSRHIMAGASAASAWLRRRTGSRSPSVARCRMQRASSLARTSSMPLHLSVNQASSNAASRIASVLGSNDPLPSPRMFPLSARILLEAASDGIRARTDIVNNRLTAIRVGKPVREASKRRDSGRTRADKRPTAVAKLKGVLVFWQ